MRLLVIEDEPQLRQQLATLLKDAGYIVDTCADGKEGLFNASEYPLDGAIIDLGLPQLSGIDIIKALRQQGKTLPILILTARSNWQNKVEGLEAGADDYLVKPFQPEELLARIKALLRRSAGSANAILQFPPYRLDLNSQSVTKNQQTIELTQFEYLVFEYLVKQKGKVVSKVELADYLYPHETDRDSNVIEVLVGRLRRKLDPDNELTPIETLRGRGYRFTLTPE